MPQQSGPTFVDGVAAFADRYEAFIFDQWGVLHDGAAAFPDVHATVAELVRRNKKLVMLSNSGRRAALSRQRLAAMGFNLADWVGMVTSGEATWQLMRERAVPPFDRLGRRCLLLTHLGDRGVVDGLDVELVGDIADADFVFASGLEPDYTLGFLEEVVAGAAARNLPMICSNPDLVALSGDVMVRGPGSLAKDYAARGGPVTYVGKPHRPIYDACFRALEGLEPGEIVAVGDSLEHDIVGARKAGIASAFVTSGIHRDHFPQGASRAAAVIALEGLIEEHGAAPDWVIERVLW